MCYKWAWIVKISEISLERMSQTLYLAVCLQYMLILVPSLYTRFRKSQFAPSPPAEVSFTSCACFVVAGIEWREDLTVVWMFTNGSIHPGEACGILDPERDSTPRLLKSPFAVFATPFLDSRKKCWLCSGVGKMGCVVSLTSPVVYSATYTNNCKLHE